MPQVFRKCIIVGALIASCLPLVSSVPARAACDALPDDKGLAVFKVPVDEAGTYALWLRMRAASDGGNSIFVQVDDQCAVAVGNSPLAKELTWVGHQANDTNARVRVDLAQGEHIVKVTGRDVGVAVDKLLLTKRVDCAPVSVGDNCLYEEATTVSPATSDAVATPSTQKSVQAKHALNWWVVGVSAVAALGAFGFLIWKYHTFIRKVAVEVEMAGVQLFTDARLRTKLLYFVRHHLVTVGVCLGIVVAAIVVGVVGAVSYSTLEAENATLYGGAKIVDDATASGNKSVVFEKNPTGTTVPAQALQQKGTASSTSNATGSSSGSTGNSGDGTTTPPPAPTPGTTYPARYSVGAPGVGTYKQSDSSLPMPSGYTQILPNDGGASEAYNMYSCSGTTTLDHVYIRAFIYIGTDCHGTINITNSIIAPPPGSNQRAILVNADNSASLAINISDTTIRPEPVGLGGMNAALTDHVLNDCETCSVTMNRVDVANSGGMCLCGKNVTVQNSWLHDNYIAHLPDPSVAHTGGVFPYGGDGPVTIRNNRLEPGVNAFTGAEVPNYWKAITAVLFTQSEGGSKLRNYTVEGNFISLGAFDMGMEDGEGLVIRNNVFGPNHWGYTTTCSSGCSVTIAQWSGNVVGDIAGTPTATVVPKPF